MKKFAVVMSIIMLLSVASAFVPVNNPVIPDLSINSEANSYYTIYDAKSDLQTLDAHGGYLCRGKSTNTKKSVRAMQRLLNYFEQADLEVDGMFGPACRQAVLDFQHKYNLTIDACFGSECRNKIRQLISKELNPPAYGILNFDDAYNYARKYWNKRNSAYNYYNGNNCANYISQILIAAGMDTDRVFKNGSYAFINVDGLSDYLQSEYGIEYISGKPAKGVVEAGDIILTNNGGHVMFVMDTNNDVIHANGNTNNRNLLSVSRNAISGVLKTSELF